MHTNKSNKFQSTYKKDKYFIGVEENFLLICDLMFIGHISIDQVEIPHGVKVQPGGAALYAAMAAKTLLKEQKKEPSRIIIVGRGDTLSGLIRRIYGTTSDDIVAMVRKANPNIKNINKIKPGQKIFLPQLGQTTEEKENTKFTVHVASYKLYEPAISMYRDLLENGYEAYILSTNDPEKGKIHRVTVGYFKSQKQAKNYAATLVKKGITTYAMPIEVKSK